MTPPVSVIIPCHNAEQWVQRQIDAVRAQLREGDELVLVDNRSTDGTRRTLEAAAASDRRLRVVDATDRAGANYARNRGIQAALNDLLLFCDADDVVHDGWVDAFRRLLGDGGIAGGVATPVDSDGSAVGEDLSLHVIFGGPPYPLGANMGVHRDVINAVGGFDESFSGGHDETDLAWRAHAAGWQTQLAGDARIDYLQRPDARAIVRQRRNYARTAVQLWARHRDTVHPHGVSLKGAVQGLLRSLPIGIRAARGKATPDEAAAWGWTVGLVDGHLRYRLLGKPPAPLLPPISAAGVNQSPVKELGRP